MDEWFLAVSSGSVQIVRHLIDKCNIDISCTNARGHTALSIAAAYGYTDVVKLLLDKNAIVNSAIGRTQMTALHIAAANGFPSVVQVLNGRGADKELRDFTGSTAMDYSNMSPQAPLDGGDEGSDRIDAADARITAMRYACIQLLG